MESILYLVHRIPFPPNKGDKIVSHHLLRHLATRYRVHLGTFIDDPADAGYASALDEWCASRCVIRLRPRSARLRSIAGFLTGEALTLHYYRSAQLRQWVESTVAENDIRKAVVFSSAMAQYVERLPELRVVLDLVDVDSAKWKQYADRRGWPLSFIYRREAERLLEVERRAAAQAVATILVTRGEADLFIRLAPECSDRIQVIENGVDTGYFAPHRDRPTPYSADESPIVFTGAMDYWPNIDAVTWFAREVLPLVEQKRSDARFYIVGMNPAKAVNALAAHPRVIVTGAVSDVRPYLQHAAAVVAPIRVARGIQNKVLEAMAMARPVVVSSAAARAITAVSGVDFETASNAEEFSSKLLSLMRPEVGDAMGQRARGRITADYCWARNLDGFERLLTPGSRPSVATRSIDAR